MYIKTASLDSVIIYFDNIISKEVLDDVLWANELLKKLDHIVDKTPSYSSILVTYDRDFYTNDSIKKTIHKLLKNSTKKAVNKSAKTIEIEVDYTKGVDLKRVARFNKLSIQEVIDIHVNKTYHVYAIGFIVGFAYLAKVDNTIATPRLDTPRSKVPKGSVAIADNQSAIYPADSAGGWNILGMSEFDCFERFEVGDCVRFKAL